MTQRKEKYMMQRVKKVCRNNKVEKAKEVDTAEEWMISLNNSSVVEVDFIVSINKGSISHNMKQCLNHVMLKSLIFKLCFNFIDVKKFGLYCFMTYQKKIVESFRMSINYWLKRCLEY